MWGVKCEDRGAVVEKSRLTCAPDDTCESGHVRAGPVVAPSAYRSGDLRFELKMLLTQFANQATFFSILKQRYRNTVAERVVSTVDLLSLVRGRLILFL